MQQARSRAFAVGSNQGSRGESHHALARTELFNKRRRSAPAAALNSSALPSKEAGALHPPEHKSHLGFRARRGQLPAHTNVWTPGAAGLRAVCPPLPDTDAAPVDNRKRLTHRCLALPGGNKSKEYGRQQPPRWPCRPVGPPTEGTPFGHGPGGPKGAVI